MRSIASFQALSDRELIELARDHTSSLLGSDMHGLALVLARRLESCVADRKLLVDAIEHAPAPGHAANREHAAAAADWDVP